MLASLASVNLARNAINNCVVIRAACGSRTRTISISPILFGDSNFGSFSIPDDVSSDLKSTDRLSEFEENPDIPDEAVPVLRLDSMKVSRRVSLIKIDVEGGEYEVLKGASSLIKRHQPVVFCEILSLDALIKIKSFFDMQSYNLFWLETHPFNRNNYNNKLQNIWFRGEVGVIALPPNEVPPFSGRMVSMPCEIPTTIDFRSGYHVP